MRVRAQQDSAFKDAYASAPGGTPEDGLWHVLVLMGVGDIAPAAWDGNLIVEQGDVHDVSGYRFEMPDRVLPQGGWRMSTKVERILLGSPLGGHGSGATESALLPKGVLIQGAGSPSTRLRVETSQGACEVRPFRIAVGETEKCVGGRMEVRRILAATDLSGTELRQHDFPSIASGADGSAWITWSSYHDRQEELNFRRYKDGQWSRLIPVGRASADLWRPQVTTDASGKPWLVWSQQSGGNWDIFAMPWKEDEWGPVTRLSDNPLPDIEPHVARSADGVIYAVWQALDGRVSQIRLRYLKDGAWSETIPVTASPLNDWEPAVAAAGDGRVWIAWDRYEESYDVYCRSYSAEKGLSPEMKVAGTARLEAYASVAVDSRNRPWIAWEIGGANWGKDLGQALGPKAPGSPLGDTRRIEVACLDGQAWKSPAPFAPRDALASGSTGESRPLLFADPDGNLWMAFKRRYSRRAFRPSVFWESYLTRLDADRWVEPVVLPKSWARKSTRMGFAAVGGRLWTIWPWESRDYAFASRPKANRVIAGSVPLPGPGREPKLVEYRSDPIVAPEVHPNEEHDVAAIRGYRVSGGGETWRIVRGDLHRHTELSQDAGGLDDGSLPEFYRYMIDAARMDFGASTDHQAGGTDYWSFLTLKMTDMLHFPERFTTLYGYERNVAYPDGHRNIIHTKRDYPIVPFFQRLDPRFTLPDSPDGELLTFNSNAFGGVITNDTKLLYEELRKSGGMAIPHTSGTDSMGTDWRDNDPKLEPVVEIYQGARDNYEHAGAPRGLKREEPGLVWNAWKKGYRLGVISSSDHFSTHISYAMVYTPEKSRAAIFDSIMKRRTYGATDNIILEFWIGDRFMGEDFEMSGRPKVRIKVTGTDVIDAVHLIRNARYIHKFAPHGEKAELEFVDNDVSPGEHWYYVRVEQRDGELAWSSPIWVRLR